MAEHFDVSLAGFRCDLAQNATICLISEQFTGNDFTIRMFLLFEIDLVDLKLSHSKILLLVFILQQVSNTIIHLEFHLKLQEWLLKIYSHYRLK